MNNNIGKKEGHECIVQSKQKASELPDDNTEKTFLQGYGCTHVKTCQHNRQKQQHHVQKKTLAHAEVGMQQQGCSRYGCGKNMYCAPDNIVKKIKQVEAFVDGQNKGQYKKE